MVSTSIRNPGNIKTLKNTPAFSKKLDSALAGARDSFKKSALTAVNKDLFVASSSSGSGVTDMSGAVSEAMGADGGGVVDGGVVGNSTGELGNAGSSSGGSGNTSPLLDGSMTFEELVGEICNGIDLIFMTKRSTVVVSDYESMYAEAKYLRDHNSEVVKGEDIKMWQLEDGTYELDVSEYGFYNTVKVHYKDGIVTESYEDLVRVYGEVKIDYYDKNIDKTSAIMKAKAYLAAHVREFDMSIKADILWDGDIDIGDIVTIDNPMTIRDSIKKEKKQDPEYYFVIGKSVEWEGETPITGSLELRYGAVSPEKKDVPESGTSYSNSSSQSSGDINSAIDEVGKMASKISYSGACQTHDCVKAKGTGDCFGMSDFIACELKSRGVETQIKGYPTGYASEHRSVLYKDSSGQWVRFPYRQYNVSYLFRDTDGVASGHNVNSTC